MIDVTGRRGRVDGRWRWSDGGGSGRTGCAATPSGRVLLVRACRRVASTRAAGCCPGAGVEHGEHPAARGGPGVRRGDRPAVEVTRAPGRATDVTIFRTPASPLHHRPAVSRRPTRSAASSRPEPAGATDALAWFGTGRGWRQLPLLPFTADLLGLTADRRARRMACRRIAGRWPRPAEHGTAPTGAALRGVRAGHRPGRPGAAHHDRARLSGRGPVAPARRRHRPRRAAGRGAAARVGRGDRPARPGGRAARRSHRHNRGALGPEGVPIDWHGVRVVFRVAVRRADRAAGDRAGRRFHRSGRLVRRRRSRRAAAHRDRRESSPDTARDLGGSHRHQAVVVTRRAT